MQHFTDPPPLSSSDRSTPTGWKPASRNCAAKPVAAQGSTTCCHGRIAPDQLRAAWVDIPEVISAATVTGASDAILHVLARDMRHLEAALERIRSSADVERSESIVVVSNLIDRSRP